MGQALRERSKVGAAQRRYVLRHHRRASDAALGEAVGLRASDVAAVLEAHGARRSLGDERRIDRADVAELPPFDASPWAAVQRVIRIDTRPLDRVDVILVALTFLASVVTYGLTAARTVTGEDAGELLAAAHGLGVPHPPGYPLWTLLGYLFDQIPVATTAWKVSMVSGVFAALGNALLVAIALKTLRSRVAAVLVGGLFAVSLTHWTQSVIPEVYGLNTFFVAAITLLLIRLADSPTPGRLFALAATAGVACTNHTSAIAVAGLAAFGALLVATPLLRRPWTVGVATVCAVAPLGLFLLLPLFSASDPYLDWGNPETREALVDHVLRTQYAGVEHDQAAVDPHGGYLRRLGILGEGAAAQFGGPWVLVLAVVGAVVLLWRQSGLALFLLAVGWLCSVGITQYTQYSFDREHVYANQIFFIPAWFSVAWFIGGGLDALIEKARDAWGHPKLFHGLASIAALGLIAHPAIENAPRADRSDTTLVADFGRAILDVMDEGALYLPSSDHSTFPVMYHQGVEDHRLDVVIADKYGRIDRDVIEPLLTDADRYHLSQFVGTDLRREMEAILITRWPSAVYFASRRPQEELPAGYVLEPVGPVFVAMPVGEAAALWGPDDNGHIPGLAPWTAGPLAELDLDAEDQRVDFTVQMVRGDLLFTKGAAHLRAGQVDEAFAAWAQIDGDLAPHKQIFNNAGSMLAENGRPADALMFFERALEEDPDYVTGLRNKATVQLALDQTSGAIATYERLLEVPPSSKFPDLHRTVRFQLAALLEDEERLHEALAQYRALAEDIPDDPEPWKEAGLFLERNGDFANAEGALAEALRLDPDDDSVRERLERLQSGAAQMAADLPDYGPEDIDPWLDPATMTPSGGPPAEMVPTIPGMGGGR